MTRNWLISCWDWVLDIANYFSVPVVAEGVETKEECELLRKAGCDIIQGYYFSKPVPPEEFRPGNSRKLTDEELALRVSDLRELSGRAWKESEGLPRNSNHKK